jgi:hypothetical protein
LATYVKALVTVRVCPVGIVIPLAPTGLLIVTDAAVALASTVTTVAVAITTSSVAIGATPPTHVAPADQFPVVVEVIVAASALLVETAPTKAKVKARIPTERKTFFKLNFIIIFRLGRFSMPIAAEIN